MKDRLLVICSFFVIFAFSSVDSAISPMVRELKDHFSIPMNEILWLISWCTLGIVLGVFIGPAVTSSFKILRVVGLAVFGLFLSLILFLFTSNFHLAIASRLVFGLSSGLLASCFWWITYYGVSKEYYQAMVAVLMSARPLATAIGVPMAGLIAAKYEWKWSFWIFASMIAVFGLMLFFTLFGQKAEDSEKLSIKKLFSDYVKAFKIPHAKRYYLGLTINRMCYFGFYSFAGIWFIEYYALSLIEISSVLFFIGLGEAVVNFAVPSALRRFGHQRLFVGTIVLSGILFPILISGYFRLSIAVVLISIFMLLDRVYIMAAVVSIPQMFPQAQNKTVFGSLNTLTAWTGLTIISWLQGAYLQKLGLVPIQHFLTLAFIVGSILIYQVQKATVFATKTMPVDEKPRTVRSDN